MHCCNIISPLAGGLGGVASSKTFPSWLSLVVCGSECKCGPLASGQTGRRLKYTHTHLNCMCFCVCVSATSMQHCILTLHSSIWVRKTLHATLVWQLKFKLNLPLVTAMQTAEKTRCCPKVRPQHWCSYLPSCHRATKYSHLLVFDGSRRVDVSWLKQKKIKNYK